MAAPRGQDTGRLGPRASLPSCPLQDFQVPALGGVSTGTTAHGTTVTLRPLQDLRQFQFLCTSRRRARARGGGWGDKHFTLERLTYFKRILEA